MPINRLFYTRLLILMILLQAFSPGFSQSESFPIKKWVDLLSDKNDILNKKYAEFGKETGQLDSANLFAMFRQMDRHIGTNHHFDTRYLAFKAGTHIRFKVRGMEKELRAMRDQMMNEAYKSGDNYLIFFATRSTGSYLYTLQELEASATYLLKAEELHEQLDQKSETQNHIWLLLSEILYHTRDYERCIYYSKKLLENADTSIVPAFDLVRVINTIGQAYQQLNQLDSAYFFYERSDEMAELLPKPEWKLIWHGINAGFKGQVLFYRKEYEKAKQLLSYDYSTNKTADQNIAAYSLQWIAKIDLIEGKKDSALIRVREALTLLHASRQFNIQRVNYLQSAYATATDVFKAYNNTDSVYHYSQQYIALHDSLEKVAFRSSLTVLKTRLDNEKNYQLIANLQKEKKTEKLRRNFMIAVIALISIITLLYLNRLRLKNLHKAELVLQEKNAAEEMARGQLQSLTQNLIEKAALVDELQRKQINQSLSVEKQELASTISGLTILTDKDWEKFKTLFGQLYPGFFINLQEKVKDITLAEQRMAALTKLHLTANQIATILGISPNSVYKTKQRLRQRLNLDNEASIEDAIANI